MSALQNFFVIHWGIRCTQERFSIPTNCGYRAPKELWDYVMWVHTSYGKGMHNVSGQPMQTLSYTSADDNCGCEITRQWCRMQYVGENNTSLNHRMNNHRSSVNIQREDLMVARHSGADMTGLTWKNIWVLAIERNSATDEKARPKDRRSYNNRLHNVCPFGMNGT